MSIAQNVSYNIAMAVLFTFFFSLSLMGGKFKYGFSKLMALILIATMSLQANAAVFASARAWKKGFVGVMKEQVRNIESLGESSPDEIGFTEILIYWSFVLFLTVLILLFPVRFLANKKSVADKEISSLQKKHQVEKATREDVHREASLAAISKLYGVLQIGLSFCLIYIWDDCFRSTILIRSTSLTAYWVFAIFSLVAATILAAVLSKVQQRQAKQDKKAAESVPGTGDEPDSGLLEGSEKESKGCCSKICGNGKASFVAFWAVVLQFFVSSMAWFVALDFNFAITQTLNSDIGDSDPEKLFNWYALVDALAFTMAISFGVLLLYYQKKKAREVEAKSDIEDQTAPNMDRRTSVVGESLKKVTEVVPFNWMMMISLFQQACSFLFILRTDVALNEWLDVNVIVKGANSFTAQAMLVNIFALVMVFFLELYGFGFLPDQHNHKKHERSYKNAVFEIAIKLILSASFFCVGMVWSDAWMQFYTGGAAPDRRAKFIAAGFWTSMAMALVIFNLIVVNCCFDKPPEFDEDDEEVIG